MAYETNAVTALNDLVTAINAFCTGLSTNPYTQDAFSTPALSLSRGTCHVSINKIDTGTKTGLTGVLKDAYSGGSSSSDTMYSYFGTEAVTYHFFDDGTATVLVFVNGNGEVAYMAFGELDKMGITWTDGGFLAMSHISTMDDTYLGYSTESKFQYHGFLTSRLESSYPRLAVLISGTVYDNKGDDFIYGSSLPKVHATGRYPTSDHVESSDVQGCLFGSVFACSPSHFDKTRVLIPSIFFEDIDDSGLMGVLGHLPSVKFIEWGNMTIAQDITVGGVNYKCFPQHLVYEGNYGFAIEYTV